MNYRKLGLCILALAIAFASGRYSVSQPEVRTSNQDTKKETINENKETKKKTVIVKNKDGSETTTITEDTKDKRRDSTIDKSKSSSEVIPQKVGTLSVAALLGVDSQSEWKRVYGASVSKQFIGPISVGLFGLTNGTVGCTVGLNF